MDVKIQQKSVAIEGGANELTDQSGCSSDQHKSNGTLHRHETEQTPPPLSDRLRAADSSDESLIDSDSTNDISRLLPDIRTQKGVEHSLGSPVCSPPSPSTSFPPPLRSSTCENHAASNQNRVSCTKSHASCKTDAAHIKEVAGDDCCAHCLLACLFCELLSMCSAVGQCLACGVGAAGCCEAAPGGCCLGAACTEEACQAVLDCGMLEDCCGSSDCLEICLECCSILFPS